MKPSLNIGFHLRLIIKSPREVEVKEVLGMDTLTVCHMKSVWVGMTHHVFIHIKITNAHRILIPKVTNTLESILGERQGGGKGTLPLGRKGEEKILSP